ncbi:MAG: hypothetical protein R3B69_02965 [Candidatus Paceibacterota bacterium]
MNKISIAVVGIILLAGSWYLFSHYLPTHNGVSAVNDEIATLEAELAAIDAQVQAGTLSPEAAVAARAKIADRLASVDAVIKKTTIRDLNPEQREKLRQALTKLNNVLQTYQASLTKVEAAAEVALAEKPELNRKGGRRSIAVVIQDIVETVQDEVSDIADSLEDFVDEVVDDIQDAVDDITDDDSSDDTASTTDEEETEENNDQEADDNSGDETADDDTSIEVDSETEVTATTTTDTVQ